jgi:putative transposase
MLRRRAAPPHDWTARQLPEATIGGAAPRFLIRDRDEKFGATFDRVAEEAGARVIKTAVRAPNMNAVAERCLRREALDHLMLLGEKHLGRVCDEYAHYFNKSRPHQGIRQRIPDGLTNGGHDSEILAVPVLPVSIITISGAA